MSHQPIKQTKFYKALLGGILACAVMLIQSPVQAASLKDFSQASEYAKESITRLTENNVITGDEKGYFNPKNNVSRAEMVTLLVKALGISTDDIKDAPTFKDVPKTHWAYKYVESAYREGIINGISGDLFGQANTCTREEMAAMFTRVLGIKDSDIRGKHQLIITDSFSDNDTMSVWAKDYIEFAAASGLMNGTGSGTFDPKGFANREQAAVVVDRLIQSKESISKFATAYKGDVDYPELYQAIQNSSKTTKGNLDATIDLKAINRTLDEEVTMNMKISGTFNNNDYDINYSMSSKVPEFEETKLQTRMISIGDKVYIKSTENKSWIVQDKSEYETSNTGADNFKNQAAVNEALLRSLWKSDLKRTSNITFNSTKVTKYEVLLGSDSIKSILSASSGANNLFDGPSLDEVMDKNSTVKVEFYVNGSGQIIHELISLAAGIKDSENSQDIELYFTFEINISHTDSDIKITVPADAKAAEPNGEFESEIDTSVTQF